MSQSFFCILPVLRGVKVNFSRVSSEHPGYTERTEVSLPLFQLSNSFQTGVCACVRVCLCVWTLLYGSCGSQTPFTGQQIGVLI